MFGAAETAQPPKPARMPLLVIIGGSLSGISVVLFIIGVVAGQIPVKSYTGLEVYSAVAINLVLVGTIIGLVTRKAWSRPLMIAFWVLVLASDVATFPGHRAGAKELGCTGLIGLGAAVAYLYFKSNVDKYFESLNADEPAVPPRGTPASGSA
jgi:hypothetical protein